MLINVLIAVAVLVIVLVVVLAMPPAEFRVTRKTSVATAASVVFPHVNDFHLWEAWSPWAKLDPTMQETYAGAAGGIGAIHTWSGNNKAGEGKTTITGSQPHDRIEIGLEFIRPFPCDNMVEFTFVPDGSQTVVTWTMTGKNNFRSKAFGLIMNMDKLIGADFEKGLAALKSVAEGQSPA